MLMESVLIGTADLKRVGAYGTELFEQNGKRYAKFFLISDASNLKKWKVTPASIPKRVRTFIGRPFISEPNLAHFGADNMSIDQVIKVQEQFRAGDIVEVKQDPISGIAAAIVEFANNDLGNKTWEGLQKGEAIYVSPAVAGVSTENGRGETVFHDWFGLHLARVNSPAYGVFHASIKATCQGDEKTCVQQLIASASSHLESDDSFNYAGFSCSNNMSQNSTEKPTTAMTPEEQAKKDKEMASLQTQVADSLKELTALKTAYETLKGQVENPKFDSGKPIVTDAGSDGKQAQASIDDLKKQMADMQAKQTASFTNDIITIEKDAGILADANVETRRAELMKMGSATLEQYKATITPFITQIGSLQERAGMLPNTENRVVSKVASGSTDNQLPSSLDDIKNKSWVTM